MEKNIKYNGKLDRMVKVAEAEGKGFRMLTDTFDPDWQRGDEPHGTMVFTDIHEPAKIIPPPRDLAAEIDALRERVNKLDGGG